MILVALEGRSFGFSRW